MKQFPVTDAIRKVADEQGLEQAKLAHNATVDHAFKRAKEGAIINLSDLMASQAEIIAREAGLR
jgi:predicted transcriptional regulator